MTVGGQAQVVYGYDDANRLTSITQGPSVVSINYDDADRKSTVTLPNGVIATYGYDSADQLTSMSYSSAGTTLGDITYMYDDVGNRTSTGGSWSRTTLPLPLSSASYDAANRLQTWAGQAYAYDANGNLQNDGLTTYAWNARDQLSGLAGGCPLPSAMTESAAERVKP